MDMNNLPQVRTVDQLRAAMADIGGEVVPDKDIIWFACVNKAEELSEANLRELGCLFLHGVPQMTMDGVQNQINLFFDCEEYHDDSNRSLLAAVARFYGKHALSSQILQK